MGRLSTNNAEGKTEMIDCLIYFGVFGVVFGLNFMAMRQESIKLRRLLIALGFLALLVFIGFRYNVGTDYGSYLRIYDKISNMEWSELPSLKTELLIASIFKVCSYVLVDARLIFIVLGALLLYPIYKVNKLYDYKYLAYSVLTFCVLFLPFGLNGMRQGIAMGFTLLAFVRFIKGSNKMGIIDFTASVLFHTSAWIALPYIIAIYARRKWNISFTKMNIILTAFIAIAVLFFLNSILVEHGITRYNYMLGSTDVEKISLKNAAVYIPIVLFMLSFHGKREQEMEILIMKNLVISGICLFVVGTSAQYLTRFGLYFMMPSIILLPKLIQSITAKRMRVITKGLFIAYLIGFFVVQYAIFGKHEILPYQTWMFEETPQISLVNEEENGAINNKIMRGHI